MSSQRSWWPRPRSSENASNNAGNPSGLKRSQLVSALSFTSRSKPKRASDIVVSPRSVLFVDRPLPIPSDNPGFSTNFQPDLPPNDPSKIPLASTRTPKPRLHSKTLPSSSQRPHITTSLKLEPPAGNGWSSKLGITAFSAQKKASSNTSDQPPGPSFPRRLTLGKRDRLPLPKAPPQVDLPPTPTSPSGQLPIRPSIQPVTFPNAKPTHDDGALSPLSCTSKSSVQSIRVETLSLRPSHSTVSSVTGTMGDSLVRPGVTRGEQTNSSISPIETSPKSLIQAPENRGFTDTAHFVGDMGSIPYSKHLTASAALRRQTSLQQIKTTASPSRSLRHASSFSPSVVGEADSESYVYISTSASGCPSEAPLPNASWRTLEEEPSRDSKYSNPESSFRTVGEEFRCEDNRSVFSLPSENLGMQAPHQGTGSRTRRQHIVPPNELNEWMKASAISITHPPDKDTSEFIKVERSSSSGVRAMSPSLSYSSDDQSGTALRPPPRKHLGLTARKQAAVRKKQSAAASQPPVSNGIRKLENATTVTQAVRRTRPPSLHRSASFLTLDEEEDRINGQMLTKEPTGPVAGWDSDTASEEESFFDFGRGVNSMELSEGLSD